MIAATYPREGFRTAGRGSLQISPARSTSPMSLAAGQWAGTAFW